MAIITRILAAATIASLALSDVVGASAAEHYAVAAQRARAHSQHERAAHHGGAARKRSSIQKRCKASTTSTSAAHTSTTTSHHTTSTHQAVTTTHKTTSKKVETTSTKKATETPSSQTKTSSSDGKKMLAWGAADSQLDMFAGPQVGYIYDWSATPPTHDGMISISQLWGDKNLDQFRANRAKYPYLMGMNEINLGAQANMSPEDAAKMWMAEIQPYSSGKKLIAPSVTTAPSGLDVLQTFFDNCKGCDFDYVQAHVYSTDSADVIKYVQTLYQKFKIPVMITETACQSFSGGGSCSTSQAEQFIQEVTKFAYETSYVAAIAPFGVMEDLGNVAESCALLSTSGKLTSLGSWFVNFEG